MSKPHVHARPTKSWRNWFNFTNQGCGHDSWDKDYCCRVKELPWQVNLRQAAREGREIETCAFNLGWRRSSLMDCPDDFHFENIPEHMFRFTDIRDFEIRRLRVEVTKLTDINTQLRTAAETVIEASSCFRYPPGPAHQALANLQKILYKKDLK